MVNWTELWEKEVLDKICAFLFIPSFIQSSIYNSGKRKNGEISLCCGKI